jgi:hypothetical protein
MRASGFFADDRFASEREVRRLPDRVFIGIEIAAQAVYRRAHSDQLGAGHRIEGITSGLDACRAVDAGTATTDQAVCQTSSAYPRNPVSAAKHSSGRLRLYSKHADRSVPWLAAPEVGWARLAVP